jgi:hypothetical protein
VNPYTRLCDRDFIFSLFTPLYLSLMIEKTDFDHTPQLSSYYFFVDESGDPNFYDRHGKLIVGTP